MTTMRLFSNRSLLLAPLAALVLPACSAEVTEFIDEDLRDRVETVEECFPDMFDKVQRLLEVANTWRLNPSSAVPDPTGLTWSEQGDGSIDVEYVANGCTIDMNIVFYSPSGAAQDLNLTGATTLHQAIDLAATELGTAFPSTNPFMVGTWTISGNKTAGTISGGGSISGIIGGTSNQNELEELRTTSATPIGTVPPNADSTVTATGTDTCTLTFNTQSIQTDTQPQQEYPIGDIAITLQGPQASVSANITFDGTVIAVILVDNIPGQFEFNLDTNDLSYRR
jgi:hypothetical protein